MQMRRRRDAMTDNEGEIRQPKDRLRKRNERAEVKSKNSNTNAEFSLRLKSNGTCDSIERAILSNAHNSIESPTVAT